METGRPFNEILQHYALERFLYRLSVSSYRECLVLKGALSFSVSKEKRTRPTRDIDFLGITDNSVENIEDIVKEICSQNDALDGIEFRPGTVDGQVINDEKEYVGVRVKFLGYLGRAKIYMQVDVGFGDLVTPGTEEFEYPVILDDLPVPKLLRYPFETVIAEKFEAMVKLGELNSRIKDFYDVWFLSHNFSFNGETLADAIKATFNNRGTSVHPNPVALTRSFSTDESRGRNYRAFIRKSLLDDAPADFSDLVDAVAVFLIPIAEAIAEGRDFHGVWEPPGPWKEQ